MKKDRKNTAFSLIILLIVLFCIMIISATLGVADIGFFEGIRILLNKIPIIGGLINTDGIKDIYSTIVLKVRLPRIFMAAIVGSSLSVVGAAYQGMFKNPMADPYVLGISSGSALGASIAIVLGFKKGFMGIGAVGIFAFIFSLLTAFLVYNFARVKNKIPTVNLLLSGIAVSFFCSSLMSVVMMFNRDNLEDIVFWNMGSVAAANWESVFILFVINTIGILLIFSLRRDLNIMSVDEDSAKTLGVEVEKVKKYIIFISSLIVAFTVAQSGIIGFVGLVIPHVVRIIWGPDFKKLIPLSVVVGAIFLVICDTLARILVPPAEIPVGVITSLFGVPFFIYLLNKNKKRGI